MLGSFGAPAQATPGPSPQYIAAAIAQRHAVDAARASAEARAAATNMAGGATTAPQGEVVTRQRAMVPSRPSRFRYTEVVEERVEDGQGGVVMREQWRRTSFLDAADEQAVRMTWPVVGRPYAAEQMEQEADEQQDEQMEEGEGAEQPEAMEE